MEPTDEELLHAFYAGNQDALEELAERLETPLLRIARVMLNVRTGVANLSEWDIDERLLTLWSHVHSTSQVAIGRWPHQRLTGLAWLIHLLCLEMDRHLGFKPPY